MKKIFLFLTLLCLASTLVFATWGGSGLSSSESRGYASRDSDDHDDDDHDDDHDATSSASTDSDDDHNDRDDEHDDDDHDATSSASKSASSSENAASSTSKSASSSGDATSSASKSTSSSGDATSSSSKSASSSGDATSSASKSVSSSVDAMSSASKKGSNHSDATSSASKDEDTEVLRAVLNSLIGRTPWQNLSEAERQKIKEEAKKQGLNLSWKSDGTLTITERDGTRSEMGTKWNGKGIQKYLPTPKFAGGISYLQDKEEISIVASLNIAELKDYWQSCKDKGFTRNIEEESYTYGAYTIYSFRAEDRKGNELEIAWTDNLATILFSRD